MKKSTVVILLAVLIAILIVVFTIFILKNQKPTPTPSPTPTIVSDEDLIGSFFAAIDADMVDQAIFMLSPSARQGQEDIWRSNFSSLESIKITKIEKAKESQWDTGTHYYKVTLDVKTKEGNNDFGWSMGNNTRWLTVSMAGDKDKYIEAIAENQ